jgi:hypothetical protein
MSAQSETVMVHHHPPNRHARSCISISLIRQVPKSRRFCSLRGGFQTRAVGHGSLAFASKRAFKVATMSSRFLFACAGDIASGTNPTLSHHLPHVSTRFACAPELVWISSACQLSLFRHSAEKSARLFRESCFLPTLACGADHDQRGPQSSMHPGHFARNELRNDHLGVLGKFHRDSKDRV